MGLERTIHVFSSGTFRQEGNTVCFEGGEGRRFLPVEAVREICVHGEVDLNKRFLEFLSKKEVVLHYFSHYGYYMGSFYPREHYNSGYMTLRQAEHYLDEEKRLRLARAFVEGSLGNVLRVEKYYAARGKDLGRTVEGLEALSRLSGEQGGVPELMAIEGNARDLYYRTFDVILEGAGLPFEGRSRRPPENELNALLSFGNSLMYTTVLSEIYKTHLDPRIGYLHTTNARRFSLNLDVAEIFKPIIVDRLIFTLVGKRMLGKEDFDRERGGLWLKEAARRRFVEAYEERLRATIRHRKLRRIVSYRRLIRLELYKLEKHLLGEETYEPFLALW